jgi:hypothetical protein
VSLISRCYEDGVEAAGERAVAVSDPDPVLSDRFTELAVTGHIARTVTRLTKLK